MSANRLDVSTNVYVPPADVYDFLVDFPQYAEYTEYLADVRQHGDGTVGTEYDLDLSVWKFAYSTRSQVVDLDPPERIDWEIQETIDAEGSWIVEPLNGSSTESNVHLVVDLDLDSLQNVEELPNLPFQALAAKVKPKAMAEAEGVVQQIVTDLEGEPREVDLQIHETPI